ncbi:hypothetical protein EYF80_020547 [Liparis tanakae]|uniref:Uncharacterized protein n=1 Tax=Liparis tanakae TaxID=230148 RepID=A0A4Z2HUB0_9TELE|nr:hypothetical protein EYF80_020547 [Liparis tanakae]
MKECSAESIDPSGPPYAVYCSSSGVRVGWESRLDCSEVMGVLEWDHTLYFITDLYDSSTEARLLRQLLQRLGIWIVVLGKLALHHLQVHRANSSPVDSCLLHEKQAKQARWYTLPFARRTQSVEWMVRPQHAHQVPYLLRLVWLPSEVWHTLQERQRTCQHKSFT